MALADGKANAGRTETHLVERLGAAFDSMDCPQQEWVETLLAMPAAEVDELIASLEVRLHAKAAPVGGQSSPRTVSIVVLRNEQGQILQVVRRRGAEVAYLKLRSR